MFFMEFTNSYLILYQIYQNLPKFTKIYQNLPKFTKIYQNLPKFTKIYQNLPKFTKIYQNLQKICLTKLQKLFSFTDLLTSGVNFRNFKVVKL